jgi:hypothetical protein
MEIISLVRPEHGITPLRRLRRRWGKFVMGSEHHNFSTVAQLIPKSQQ